MSICDTYDDKTKGIIESDEYFILPFFEPCDEAVFKASYVVASNVVCLGKITALFDLTVLGDVEAADVDVKGKFVCLGKCSVDGSIIVQNEIWANELNAVNIESHDRIVAQEINGESVITEGNIIVSKTLSVERLAKTEKNILCGETAYGAGMVETNIIITGEPIDLDDGVNAIESPHSYQQTAQIKHVIQLADDTDVQLDLVTYGESKYAPEGNFSDYLEFLSTKMYDVESKTKFIKWEEILSKAYSAQLNGIVRYGDISIVIWLAEITMSEYFKNWDVATELYKTYEDHFRILLSNGKDTIACNIEDYGKWLEALSILRRYGALIDKTVYIYLFDRVISHIGVRSKYMSGRLNEKGWVAYVE